MYFNAWENDFSDDPLIALIGEISSAISNVDNKSELQKKFNTVKKLGVGLVKNAIPVALKLAAYEILDTEKLTEDALAGLAENIAKEKIAKYESSKKTMVGFRKALTDFITTLNNENGLSEGEQTKPLIFFIDELDRCRPNFAIELLEKAKHLFNVPNIVFVLGADREQLGSAMKAVYGEGLNVAGYLRKFIDFDFVLTSDNTEQFIHYLCSTFRLVGVIKNTIEVCSIVFEMKLRDIERACATISIVK